MQHSCTVPKQRSKSWQRVDPTRKGLRSIAHVNRLKATKPIMIKTPNEPANLLALKQQFLDRAKALSTLAEVYRGPQVTLLMTETVAFGVRAEAEIFEAAYADPSGRKYWEAYLSEPILVYPLAHVLSAYLAEKVEQLELARIAIIWAFRDAAEAGECWFIGDISPLLALEQGQANFENLGKVKVKPRAAVEWLLSKPKRDHLVPRSLRMILESGGEPDDRTKRRPLTEILAGRFTADYIKRERAAGRDPTMVGLEAAAKQANFYGGRNYLRAALRRDPTVEVRRGRPGNAPGKIAEK